MAAGAMAPSGGRLLAPGAALCNGGHRWRSPKANQAPRYPLRSAAPSSAVMPGCTLRAARPRGAGWVQPARCPATPSFSSRRCGPVPRCAPSKGPEVATVNAEECVTEEELQKILEEERSSNQEKRELGDTLTSAMDENLDYVEGSSGPNSDLYRAVGLGSALAIFGGVIFHDWVADHSALTMTLVFIIGYIGIIFEGELAFNKSGVALLMAVSLWVIKSLSTPVAEVDVELREAIGSVSEIVFFLMGAMTIVETVDAHQGFKVITDFIKTRSTSALLWAVSFISFFLSAILDNLTTTIVMLSLTRKLVPDKELRQFFGAVIVIAANAGGAWTPIGDVTTTMLWINGQISTLPTMRDLFLPSLASLLVPLGIISLVEPQVRSGVPLPPISGSERLAPRGKLVLAAGVGALLGVPLFKSVTGLPPYLGMLLGLGALWLLTDVIHYGEERSELKVAGALKRIDTQGVLFFLGILMAVESLDAAGILRQLADVLNENVPGEALVATTIGLASALVDNVPLVAATMGMYSMDVYQQDASLWQLIAYCAGTGGSILVIGSAAGVALMGIEKVDFMWYVRKVSGFALAGYLAGIGVYLASQGGLPPLAAL